MRVIGLAGWSGAGKTTLLVKLIPLFVGEGLRVATIKHAHHAFDLDQPGKDSFAHRAAGATEVVISSSRRYAILHELGAGEPESTLADLLRRVSAADLIVVEGFKAQGHPKIEVHRQGNGKPLLHGTVPNIRAVASDALLSGVDVPVLDLSDVASIAQAARTFAAPLDNVLRDLAAAPPPRPRA